MSLARHPRMRLLGLALGLGLTLAACGPAAAQPVPDPGPGQFQIDLHHVAGGFDQPVHVVAPPDGSGRLFVVERQGTIRVVMPDGSVLPEPFLNLTPIVGSRGLEQGLLGLAFHPQYATNGRFFLNYTNPDGDTVIARYEVSWMPNVGDPGTGQVIMWLDQPAANHNGGNLVFGPDGYLWIGTGDGGASGDRFGNGQNRQSLLGKMLRIDVDSAEPYAIPPDNPFYGSPDTWAEIWAIGLRNPWRYSFDRATGDLYLADVGQNAREEVNFQPWWAGGGQNYGWPIMEGLRCYPAGTACSGEGLTHPVVDYPTGDGNCAVTGGFVYRGAAFPQMHGAYVYADYCSGRVWSLHHQPDGAWTTRLHLDTDLAISSFGEDQDGELYLMDLRGGGLYRVVAS